MELSGVDVAAVASQYQTPLYAYQKDVILAKGGPLKALRDIGVHVLYSVKANPNSAIVGLLRAMVDGADVSSEGEINIALANGFTGEEVFFVGPGKTYAELVHAVTQAKCAIVIESIQELLDIQKLAGLRGTTARVVVRLYPGFSFKGSRLLMSGSAKQFGVEMGEMENVFKILKNSEALRLEGFHFFAGGQVLDADSLIENMKNEFRQVERICERWSIAPLKYLNLGGGIGIPYFRNEAPFNIGLFIDRMSSLLAEERKKGFVDGTTILMELGRYLVAEAGCYITRVLYTKKTCNQHIAVLDGGINHVYTAVAMGRFMRSEWKVINASRPSMPSSGVAVEYVGPLCTPIDTLLTTSELPFPERGDLIVFLNTGAYGLSASMTAFLSRRRPKEILI